MSEGDAEQELESIHKQVGGWFDAFLNSRQFETLTEAQRDEAPSVVRLFAEYSFSHVGMTPEKWNRSGLTDCCIDVLPRKMSAGRAFFQAVAPVLSNFFDFLAEGGLLSNGRVLAKAVAGLGEEIVAASEDKRSWRPAKAFVMAAEEAGVDLSDRKAMERFMVLRNLQLLSRQPAVPPVTPQTTPSLPEPVMPVRRSEPKIGRNDPCPCGSGKKFKKCCGR
jgi:SEC-C motif